MFATAQANEFNVRDRFFSSGLGNLGCELNLAAQLAGNAARICVEVSRMTTSFKGTCCQGGVSNFSHGTHTHVLGCRQLKRNRED